MVRLRKKARQRRHGDYDEFDISLLRSGVPLQRIRRDDEADKRLASAGGLIAEHGFGVDLDAARVAWAEIGTEVTERHIAERPGTRPWCWWLDRPHRLMFSGEAPPAALIELHPTLQHPPTWFGCPPWARIPWMTFPQFDGESDREYRRRRALPKPVFESQSDYLIRLALLTPEELGLAKAKQKTPGVPT